MIAIIFIHLSLIIVNFCEANLIAADNAMTRMVEISAAANPCLIYNDPRIIEETVLKADPKFVRQMETSLVENLEEICKVSKNKGHHLVPRKRRFNNADVYRFFQHLPPNGGLMYPGTKWCGPGNSASHYNDFGSHMKEDKCCRDHDHCPVSLLPNQCNHGVCNNSIFVKSDCNCDTRFRRCLQMAKSDVADVLGALYFNVVKITCLSCVEWSKKTKKCSRYQFYPSNMYKSIRR